MSFESDINRFVDKVKKRQEAIHREAANEIHRSIVKGSEVTGSPGQPVDTGYLKGSWQIRFIEPLLAAIITFVKYAPNIEENIGRGGKPMTLKSEVGGFHSVELTRAGFGKILNLARIRVVK